MDYKEIKEHEKEKEEESVFASKTQRVKEPKIDQKDGEKKKEFVHVSTWKHATVHANDQIHAWQ